MFWLTISALILGTTVGSLAILVNVFVAVESKAALAAGIFHRREVEISAVKEHLQRHGIEVWL